MRGCWRQSGTGGGDIRMKFIEEHCVLLVVLAKVHPETRGEAVKRKSGKVKERYGKALLQVLEGGVDPRAEGPAGCHCDRGGTRIPPEPSSPEPELLLFYLPCLCTPRPFIFCFCSEQKIQYFVVVVGGGGGGGGSDP